MNQQNQTKQILGNSFPVFGLSPMDGVTDRAFRTIVRKYGNPQLIFTEFTHVHGLCVAGENLLHHFDYDESERIVIAQIYGHEPEYFYHAAKIVIALGFDGVDINMGCPAKKVSLRGAGAGLIKTPDLAREIIYEVKRGVADWVRDGQLTGLSPKSQRAIEAMIERNKNRITKESLEIIANKIRINDKGQMMSDIRELEFKAPLGIFNLLDERHINIIQTVFPSLQSPISRFHIPTSVKTRTGYDEPVTELWIKNLANAKPDWISVHGRTLKQLYSGKADRNEIAIAVQSTDLPVLANGDIDSYQDALNMMEQTKAFGVLIGQGTYGNPWLFKQSYIPSRNEILETMLEHAELFDSLHNSEERAFVQMRKHFGWYWTLVNKLSDMQIEGSKDIKMKLVGCRSVEGLRGITASLMIK